MNDRRAIRSRWSLLGEWWCYPIDQTVPERVEMLESIRDGLYDDFAICPLEYIEDRLFGGFRCDESDRRHAYFATACYSFIAAGEGRFWALDEEGRQEQWERLLKNNKPGEILGDGPFTQDFPGQPKEGELTQDNLL